MGYCGGDGHRRPGLPDSAIPVEEGDTRGRSTVPTPIRPGISRDCRFSVADSPQCGTQSALSFSSHASTSPCRKRRCRPTRIARGPPPR